VKVVFDANVLLGALAKGGTCDQALRLAISRHRVITSAPILADVRAKLVRKFRFSPESAEAMEALVRRIARVVRPLDVPRTAGRRSGSLTPLLRARVRPDAAAGPQLRSACADSLRTSHDVSWPRSQRREPGPKCRGQEDELGPSQYVVCRGTPSLGML
jgi:hypothetical protein